MTKRRSSAFVILAVINSLSIATAAFSQIATIDDPNLGKRSEDETNSADSKEKKDDETGFKKAVVCTYSSKYRSEMFSRTPADALNRDAANVAMIRHYAKKYDVPEGLALSVSYQEARFDTCAGSHTGVKGAMQLTKGTARGLGFDRDINEQNIEGGVKYLGMGVRRCGSTNYTCLASWYNGSTEAEQKGWAAGVARHHNTFNAYVGSPNAVAPAAPQFSIETRSGSSGTAQAGGASAINAASQGLNTSSVAVISNENRIGALVGAVGSTAEYKDAWEENSTARTLNAEILNQYIKQALLLNELLNNRLMISNTETSEASKSVSTEEGDVANPFSCDPAKFSQMKLAFEKWPKCAVDAWQSAGGQGFVEFAAPDAQAAAQNVKNLQID